MKITGKTFRGLTFALAAVMIGTLVAGTPRIDKTDGKIRAVQLDLARQKENIPFIKSFLGFAKDSGFNTVILYLEGRIKTKTFPYREAIDSYTPDEMREVVAEAESLGIDIVPVIPILAHVEQFVKYPELKNLSEERDGIGRFGKHSPSTFCHSLPETRIFLEKYLSEICEIFPGKNFHVSLDESFNTGFCELCSPKMKSPGLGGIYMEVITWAHDFLAKKGKRMWMWDDFFEFFPERLKDAPQDILMCNWEYSPDVSVERGPWGHFGERYRRNWIAEYAERGVDAVVCPWHDPVNVEKMSLYGAKAGSSGFLLTQWEMSMAFHVAALPFVRTVGKWWSAGVENMSLDAAYDKTLAEMFPMLTDEERSAAKVLLYDTRRIYPTGNILSSVGYVRRPERSAAEKLAVAILKKSSLKPGTGKVASNPFSPEAVIDDLVVQSEQKIYKEYLASFAASLRSVRRSSAEIRAIKEEVRLHIDRLAALCARRREQEAAWRKDCRQRSAAESFDTLLETAKGIASMEVTLPREDEWQIEMQLVLPDFHGRLEWNVFAEVDGKWVQVLKSARWKPSSGENAYYERIFPACAKLPKPPTALKIVHNGYGAAGLAHIAVANRSMRLEPSSITSITGMVRSPENVLEDTVAAAWFGDPRVREQILDPDRGKIKSSMTVSLK